MSTENEQFRPGFEAWVLKNSGDHAKWLLARSGSGWYINVAIQGKWESWTAAKRDASTEPSYNEGAHAVDLLKHLRAKAASKGYVAIESAIDAAPVLSAALPDEATDAARRTAVIDALSEHRMVLMYEVEADGALGNSYPLIDRLCLGDGLDIASGAAEIVAIADAVLDALDEFAAIEAQKGGQHES